MMLGKSLRSLAWFPKQSLSQRIAGIQCSARSDLITAASAEMIAVPFIGLMFGKSVTKANSLCARSVVKWCQRWVEQETGREGSRENRSKQRGKRHTEDEENSRHHFTFS